MLCKHEASPGGMNLMIHDYYINLHLVCVYERDWYLFLKSGFTLLWIILDAFYLETPVFFFLIIHVLLIYTLFIMETMQTI